MGSGCCSFAAVQPSSISKNRITDKIGAPSSNKIPDTITDYDLTCSPRSPRIRIDICDGERILPTIKGENCQFQLSYCFISQRGYYPSSLGKANQDSYAICENFLGDKNTHLFGIFDGHGEYGDLCSHFAANMIPYKLANELKKRGGLNALDGDESVVVDIHTRALIQSNDALHSSEIDDELSGTTAISVLVHNDHLFIANVGTCPNTPSNTPCHPLTHSLTHLLTHPLTHPLTHSLTHLLTHPLTHSLKDPLTPAL